MSRDSYRDTLDWSEAINLPKWLQWLLIDGQVYGMAPRKLSESDKQDILDLYRQTEETTSTLANRYSVSNTTISRILKQNLSDDEYESLIQQKRATARGHVDLDFDSDEDEEGDSSELVSTQDYQVEPSSSAAEDDLLELESLQQTASQRRQRKRTTVATTLTDPASGESGLPVSELVQASEELADDVDYTAKPSTLQEILEEEIVVTQTGFEDGLDDDDELDDEELDDEELDDDLDDDELDDDDLDDDDLEEDDEDVAGLGVKLANVAPVQVQVEGKVHVLPLSEASIPKTFYLVVDRASELITRPLKDFAELGQIPAEEIQEKTLPIFDNHRVAKRFLRRMQRVIKVPDGKMLYKVGPYLQAKGITRLLIDGQIYSL